MGLLFQGGLVVPNELLFSLLVADPLLFQLLLVEGTPVVRRLERNVLEEAHRILVGLRIVLVRKNRLGKEGHGVVLHKVSLEEGSPVFVALDQRPDHVQEPPAVVRGVDYLLLVGQPVRLVDDELAAARVVRILEELLQKVGQILDRRWVGAHPNPDVIGKRKLDRSVRHLVEEDSVLAEVRVDARKVEVHPSEAFGERLHVAGPELVVADPDASYRCSLGLGTGVDLLLACGVADSVVLVETRVRGSADPNVVGIRTVIVVNIGRLRSQLHLSLDVVLDLLEDPAALGLRCSVVSIISDCDFKVGEFFTLHVAEKSFA